ncbi:hypothetical protein J2Y45_002899 [Dyadobacter sp. BE34]|uniref:Uncharacterized protein n=1 Tax=Dyadobacter fermentans TaxID=94254 RepID=A0ABU1QUE5_9BACT|nr:MULTISPECIES: hypothetical protein [Dyadobacter]MDR6804793.1 hypothetical protein [Dyadobacter fermentans]MDR7043448.1 hypothetical protein [Dyadobacter sp. BE242]MDR7197760.1 hypothetical protein [Dyadobacter sp. BE34]MDR7214807.1 hypothetical protein [Dyadobacter sp. BE31]MDR7262342.1 hypothetical protein [Dyadobacter sp. BE32]
MSAAKQEFVIEAIVAQITEARRTNKHYLIYTIPSSDVERKIVESIIVDLRTLGFHATHFSIPDQEPETPSSWDIYICWTETAKQDAVSRGYIFD